MSQPKLKYFIQCDEVKNDNGKFSAIGIFDTIFSFIFPVTHKRFFVLMGLIGGEGKYDLEVQVQGPDGTTIARAKSELVLQAAEQTGNAVFGFESFPLPIEGEYTIAVFLDGDFFCSHTFRAQPPFRKKWRTPEEIAMLMSQPDIVKSANVEVACERCKSTYRFQHTLDPMSPVEAGFLRLPPGEMFECAVCGQQIGLQQLRENLENIVGIPRQWLDKGGIKPQHARPPAKPPQEDGGSPKTC